ncbi:ER membrane protein complex subunit 7 [Thoreauomyces humboldtii]|nr:ER membrane protein complex subunit 7 [Thoreauomyces humboldtii]
MFGRGVVKITGLTDVFPTVDSDVTELVGTKVWINGGQLSAPSVPDGTHLLTVASPLFHFDPVRLDVSSTGVMASQTANGVGWGKLGPPLLTPIELTARGRLDFFLKREQFNPWSLLSNPMLLMSGGSMLLFFVMPKMMAAMPQEDREELEAKPAAPTLEMPDISASLANWFAPPAPSPGKGGKKK